MRLVAAALLCCTAGCATMAPVTAGRIGYIGTATADVYTTQQAIERGAVEANPIVVTFCGNEPSVSCMTAMKAASYSMLTGLEWMAADIMERPLKWWESLLFIYAPGIVLQTWVSFHNNGVAR